MERKSRQKDAIRSVLGKKNFHPSVEDIYNEVKKIVPGIGIATVYRNVERLADDGKIVKIEVPGQGARVDGNVEKHYHFRCLACGFIEDIKADAVVEEAVRIMSSNNSNTVIDHTVEFTGFCSRCSKLQKQ